jgi:MIP family channel proteins
MSGEFSLLPYVRKARVSNELVKECIGEFAGTMTLMIFGIGVLAQTHLGRGNNNDHGTFLSVSLGWGIAIFMAVFVSGRFGKGHFNPSASLAFALVGKASLKRVPFYWLAQYLGAFIGSLLVFGIYYERITMEAKDGMNASEGHYKMMPVGNIFVTNPHGKLMTCFLDQVFGTALLCGGALTIVDRNNFNVPEWAHPINLGLMVFGIVGCFAVNAGAALNPARDLSPRIMLAICGWKGEAFRAGDYYFWVPIVGPHLGAIIGSLGYELLIGNYVEPSCSCESPDEQMYRETPMPINEHKKSEV